ncbi:ATP binding domain 4 [Gaertneriomyces sp. JEL0708]|nr:ATP binding domain 4 [Gaertneriomyces sp. JEL0708]
MTSIRSTSDELDSYMYQTVGHDAIDFYGECMELPLFRREIVGSSIAKDADYTVTLQDEVEDLYQLLREVKEEMPEVQAVASGAILSNYQRVRVEHVCLRLGLTSLSYLWQRDQKKLMEDMIAANVNAILIKVAAIGLEVKHLGKSLSQMYPHLLHIHELYDCHICGEGGEFETFTLDTPIFKKRIVIDALEIVLHSDDAFAPVAYAKIKKAHLEAKRPDEIGMSAELQRTLVSTMHLEVHGEPEPMQRHAPTRMAAAAVSTSIKGSYMAIGGLMARNVCKTEPPHVNRTIAEETITVMDAIQEQLQSNGFAWDCVVVMHVYLDDMSKFAQLNEAYKNYFGLNPPPRITVQLSLPCRAQVQVDCLAFRSASVSQKRSLHVQSISYWAPANIGPYSQVCYVGDQTYIAGQIGLIPQCMELVAPAADDQRAFSREALLALQHSQAILLAIGGDLVADAALCVCYVSDGRYFGEARRIWRSTTERCLIQVPVILVAVPGLPRGANVEWEIVSGNRASLPNYTTDPEDGSAEEVSDPVGYNGSYFTCA